MGTLQRFLAFSRLGLLWITHLQYLARYLLWREGLITLLLRLLAICNFSYQSRALSGGPMLPLSFYHYPIYLTHNPDMSDPFTRCISVAERTFVVCHICSRANGEIRTHLFFLTKKVLVLTSIISKCTPSLVSGSIE